MSAFEIENFKESAKIFFCSNTAGYLYTHLAILGEVENLAEELSTDELYEIGRQALERKDKNPDSELLFYIALIALSFKPYSEISSHLHSLRTHEYKWANSIISLIIAKYNLVTEDKVDIKSEPVIITPKEGYEYKLTDSTTSEISINLEQPGDEKND